MYIGNQEYIHRKKTSNKYVALTFDDGPHPVNTPTLLNLLEKFKINCTFFVTGSKFYECDSILQAMSAQGHEIGNHGFHHQSYLFYNFDFVFQEIASTDHLLYFLDLPKPTLFRPPYLRLPLSLFFSKRLIEKKIVLASTRIKDYSFSDPVKLAGSIRKKIKPGSIIPLHDGHENSPITIRALEILIPQMLDQDYKFMTVSQLMNYSSSSI